MTPLLRLLTRYLPPGVARPLLAAIYAGAILAILLLSPYWAGQPIIYLDIG